MLIGARGYGDALVPLRAGALSKIQRGDTTARHSRGFRGVRHDPSERPDSKVAENCGRPGVEHLRSGLG